MSSTTWTVVLNGQILSSGYTVIDGGEGDVRLQLIGQHISRGSLVFADVDFVKKIINVEAQTSSLQVMSDSIDLIWEKGRLK